MGYVRKPDEGEQIWELGALFAFKLDGAETDGRIEIGEHNGPRGYAAPLHTHEVEAEWFYVIEGEVTFVVGDQETRTTAGCTAFIPAGEPHAFRVDSPTAKFLMAVTPAGFLPFFREVGEPALSATMPPPPETPPDPERLAAIGRRYGMEVVGPPPGAA